MLSLDMSKLEEKGKINLLMKDHHQTSIGKGIYKHYKGNYYHVLGTARHTETHELMVVYRALYASDEFGHMAVWTRPLDMFKESVEWEGQTVPRFTFICNQPEDF